MAALDMPVSAEVEEQMLRKILELVRIVLNGGPRL